MLYYDQVLSLVPQLLMHPDYYIIIDMIFIIFIMTRNWYVITGMAIVVYSQDAKDPSHTMGILSL